MERQPNPENAKWQAEDEKSLDTTPGTDANKESLETEVSPEEQIEELEASFKESRESANETLAQFKKASDETLKHWEKNGGEFDPQDMALLKVLRETGAVQVSQMVETMRGMMKAMLQKEKPNAKDIHKLAELGIGISNAQDYGGNGSLKEKIDYPKTQGLDAEMIKDFDQITKKSNGEESSPSGDLVDLLTTRALLPEDADESTIAAARDITERYDRTHGTSTSKQVR